MAKAPTEWWLVTLWSASYVRDPNARYGTTRTERRTKDLPYGYSAEPGISSCLAEEPQQRRKRRVCRDRPLGIVRAGPGLTQSPGNEACVQLGPVAPFRSPRQERRDPPQLSPGHAATRLHVRLEGGIREHLYLRHEVFTGISLQRINAGQGLLVLAFNFFIVQTSSEVRRRCPARNRLRPRPDFCLALGGPP
jgi:hypothetical protein